MNRNEQKRKEELEITATEWLAFYGSGIAVLG
jgi:hypothetical protein